AVNGMAAINPTFSTNEFYGLDIRASKAITLSGARRVELIAQVFNILNRKNILGAWTTNALSPAFGTSVSASNMRQAEIAARFTFSRSRRGGRVKRVGRVRTNPLAFPVLLAPPALVNTVLTAAFFASGASALIF